MVRTWGAFSTFLGLSSTLLCVAFSIGCGDRHRPVVRTGEAESEPESQPAMPPGHGEFLPQAKERPVETGPVVTLDDAQLTAPAAWVRKTPRSGFVRAEFSLPKVEGDAADGRLTISSAGGSIKDNIERWRGQFAGKPEKDSQETLKVGGTEVTLVDISGTFLEGGMMMGPVKEQPGYRMLGAIFNLGGNESYFIKAYGPAKTMGAHAEEFRKFVQSLAVKKPAK